jgi:AmiR/NasT family two-component response regulator
MRIWLVDEKDHSRQPALEKMLRSLEERPELGLRLLGTSPFQRDFADAMGKLLPDLLEILVVNEAAWPEGSWMMSVLNQGVAMVVVCRTESAERFRSLAEEYPITLIAPDCGEEGLWLALLNAHLGRRRHCRLKEQLHTVNQRLSDRIIIERAKGILIQMHSITEEEAYKRLQLFSRSQRRKIRDIAQSVLEMKSLFTNKNGVVPEDKETQPANPLTLWTDERERPAADEEKRPGH